jgi:signal transduction histidine kinase
MQVLSNSTMKLGNVFARQPRGWILAEMVIALLVIGLLDFTTSYQFRLLPIYAGPIFVAGWFFGGRYGTATAAFSAIIWWCANWFSGDPELRSWVAPWEITRHVTFFFVVGWTAAALRAKQDIVAARIALLEHSRRLEQEVVTISETAQRRIGQDLHDGVCQVLAALSCSATSLRTDLEKRELLAEARVAGELARLLQAAVVETRDLARSLVPAYVGEVGLPIALDALAQSVSRLHRMNCRFELRGGERRADEETDTHLYRIAQEAISNSIKHGKASHITLALEVSDDVFALSIMDDGIGLPENPSKEGLGLTMMAYRARILGGELRVERLAGGGTLVACRAPANKTEAQSVAA